MSGLAKKRLSKAKVRRILSSPAPAGGDATVWLAFQDFIADQYETKGYAETYCACGGGGDDGGAPARNDEDRVIKKVGTVIATGYDLCDSFLSPLTDPFFIRAARFVASMLGISVCARILLFFIKLF